MALKGDLKSINLANVLQDVASNELTGTLSIQTGQNHRFFWFEKGRLRLVGLGNGKGPSPVNGLLALGKVKAGDISPRGGNVTLVRGLVRKGAVGRDDVRAGLEHQMIEHMCDVFVWSDAHFEFADGDPDEDVFETAQLDQEIRLPADPIIMEALRRVDEWGEIRKSVLSPEEIYVAARDRVPDGDPTIERVAGLFDGERRLRDIIDQTHLGQFAVFRAAAALLRTGAVRALTVKEAIEKARAAAAKKQHEQALRLARFGLEREPNNAELRLLTGETLEALERPEEAVSHYRQLAAAQVEHGQKDQAVATCRRILALAPRDTFTHERLFALLVELGKKTEALQQGESLAAAYKRAGLPDKAKDLYTRLIQAFGDDDELLESAGEVARRLGDKKEAIQLYRRLFERALARGDNDAVVQHARTILRLDPAAEDVAKRRMEVETGVYRKRQQFRRRLKIFGTLAVVLCALVYALAYELKARSFLSRIRADAIQLLQKKDFRSLLRRYNDFLDTYRFSLAIADARKERDDLEASYVEQELPKLPVIDAQLLDAIAAAEDIQAFVRLDASRKRAYDLLVDLRKRRGEIENEFIDESRKLADAPTPEALARIAQMDHPLALRAVGELARHKNVEVRRAAVQALGVHGSDAALEVLVNVVAEEEVLAIKEAARDHLKRASGQDFGDDADQWKKWLRKRAAPDREPPLLASLVVDKGTEVHWRLQNVSKTTIEFTFDRAFEGFAGERKLNAKPRPPDPRRVQLRADEYLGGPIDLRECLDGLEAPGSYLVGWTARVSWGGAGEVKISSVRIRLDLKK